MVKRVRLNKEYVILERDGVPVAGVMDIDEFEDYLELQDPKVRAVIRKGTADYLAGKSFPAREVLGDLLHTKKGRSSRRRTA